jgi:hypothetical protein
MKQEMVIKREDRLDENEDSALKFDLSSTHFSTYEKWRDYFHIQINGHDGLNIYLEMSPYEVDDLIKMLQKKRDQRI